MSMSLMKGLVGFYDFTVAIVDLQIDMVWVHDVFTLITNIYPKVDTIMSAGNSLPFSYINVTSYLYSIL